MDDLPKTHESPRGQDARAPGNPASGPGADGRRVRSSESRYTRAFPPPPAN